MTIALMPPSAREHAWQAHSMDYGLCDCGCGRIFFVMLDEAKRIKASGCMTPQRMAEFASALAKDALSCVPIEGKAQ